MSDILLQSKARINEKIAEIEEKTGKEHPTLSDGIQTLIDGYGQGEEFIGIKYSDFTGACGQPKIADARSLAGMSTRYQYDGVMGTCLFYNPNKNMNGGFHSALEEVYVPDGITGIIGTFKNCGNLKTIHGNFESVTSIADGFQGCSSLTKLPYMPNVTNVGATVLVDCTNITSICFYKNAYIHGNAFSKSALKDIYCPWAEGEVSGAPWSATSATIHYNTTYDENHEPIIAEV